MKIDIVQLAVICAALAGEGGDVRVFTRRCGGLHHLSPIKPPAGDGRIGYISSTSMPSVRRMRQTWLKAEHSNTNRTNHQAEESSTKLIEEKNVHETNVPSATGFNCIVRTGDFRDDFILGARIGRGSFGVVSMCREVSTGVFFAYNTGRADLTSEAVSMFDLAHPDIIKIVGFHPSKSAAGKSAIFMEYLDSSWQTNGSYLAATPR
jgi:hypothetical protein